MFRWMVAFSLLTCWLSLNPGWTLPEIGAAFVTTTLQDQVNDGFNYITNGLPPDTMGAIGPNHFLVVINDSVAVYTRTGHRLSHVSMNSFFSVVHQGVAYPRNGSFDPRVIFDRRSNRWFATALERGNPTRSQNHIILAVCRTSDPTGTWDKYVVPVGDPPSDGYTYQTDYETLGADDNGVYFGMKIRSSSGATRYKIAATPKGPLLADPPSLGPVYQWGGISNMQCSPQPAHNQDAISPADPAWFVSSSTSGYRNINYRRLYWNGGVPTLSSTYVLSTPAYGETLDAPALGSSPDVRVSDHRLMMAVIRGGRLWTCRNVGVNSEGGALAPTRTGCEWLEVDVSGASPALAQYGRVYDNSPDNPRFYYCPSIMVNGQGHAVLAFSGSRRDEWIGAYACMRLALDPPGTMRDVVTAKAGEALYQRLDDSGRNRWGETCYTSLDPSDDTSLWTIQEFPTSLGSSIWGTCVNQLLSAAPTLDRPPASGVQGQHACTIVLSGTGFYDPGPGYANRLSVELTGGENNGISNYRVTYIGPTSVSVTFDIAPEASCGFRTIVLTNPDGQSATVRSGFLVKDDDPPPIQGPIVIVKKLADHMPVVLEGVIVSLVLPDSDVFYVQAERNKSGIRVIKPDHGLSPGMKVNIEGSIDTIDDERCILATDIGEDGAGSIFPTYLKGRSVGGVDMIHNPLTGAGQKGVTGSEGPNNIGLLVRLSGRATQRDTAQSRYFYIDDGSGLRDGTMTGGTPNVGVRIDCDPTAYPSGSYLSVRGISCCFKDGQGQLRARILPAPDGVLPLN